MASTRLRRFEIATFRGGEDLARFRHVRFGNLQTDATRRGEHVGRCGLARQLIRDIRRDPASFEDGFSAAQYAQTRRMRGCRSVQSTSQLSASVA